MRRLAQALLTLALASPVFSVACSKPSAPEPAPAASDDEDQDKPKKKKKPKKAEDEDTTGGDGAEADAAPTAPTTAGTWKPGMPTALPSTKPSTTGTAADAEKTKLMACCTALRNAAAAAAAAKTASSAVIPGMPPPAPPPQIDPAELDKAVKACDAQVAAWNGDLSGAMSKVKNASKVSLPSACAI